MSIATTLADSPSTAEAIESGRATAILQPMTEAVRTNTDIAFITIMSPDGTRFPHTDPTQIGGRYLGTIGLALRGETFTEVYTGTLGPSIRAIAPVRDARGRVVGLASAGITQQTLAQRWREQWPMNAAISLGALALSSVGVWAIRRRLLRHTHGLRPDELRVMYEHHDAILHSVSEGLVVLDRDGVVLINDEARRLLGLPAGQVAHENLPEFLRTYALGARDEVRVTPTSSGGQPFTRRRFDARRSGDSPAKHVRISRVTEWRYLERLADDGTVSRNTDYGGAGRPKTRYQWR